LLTQGAIDLGLDPAAARRLAIATLHGAGQLAHAGDGDLARMRAEVIPKVERPKQRSNLSTLRLRGIRRSRPGGCNAAVAASLPRNSAPLDSLDSLDSTPMEIT